MKDCNPDKSFSGICIVCGSAFKRRSMTVCCAKLIFPSTSNLCFDNEQQPYSCVNVNASNDHVYTRILISTCKNFWLNTIRFHRRKVRKFFSVFIIDGGRRTLYSSAVLRVGDETVVFSSFVRILKGQQSSRQASLGPYAGHTDCDTCGLAQSISRSFVNVQGCTYPLQGLPFNLHCTPCKRLRVQPYRLQIPR